MFDLIFENRQKKVNHLLKAADSLGRSLRENVSLLSINDADKEVLYLTETNKVIKATYSLQDEVLLSNIEVEDADIFTNDEKFDNIVGLKVSEFIERIYEDERSDADSSFSNLLGTWENRLKFDHVKQKLNEESQKFTQANRIIESTEFANFIEIIPQVVEFLSENKEDLETIPEIQNGAVLSEAVAQAFNFEKLSYEDLGQLKSYRSHTEVSDSVYEMICKQELIKKELLESKNNFSTVWGVSEEMSKLAGLIFETSKEKVATTLVESITSIPYLALASKKQLFESIKNSLYISEIEAVKDEEIKKYVADIFEMKKPIKGLFSNLLSEKYGVNINNLKDIPSFKSLLNTQVVIFESLSKLSPKGSVQRRVLNEVAHSLKTKNGVESIDVNDYLQIVFETAGYNVKEYSLVDSIDFNSIPKDLGNVSELVQTIMEQMGEDDEEEEVRKQEDKPKDTPDERTEEEPEEEPEEDAEEVPKEQPEEEEEDKDPKKMTLSKEEVMKGIKELEDLMSGLNLGKDEENN